MSSNSARLTVQASRVLSRLGGRYESEPVLGIVDHLGLHGILLTGVQYYVGLLAKMGHDEAAIRTAIEDAHREAGLR